MDGLFTFGNLETVEIPQAGPQAANDATAKCPIGVLLRYKGNLYRYVKFDNGAAVAAVVGGVAYWKTLTPTTGVFTVTSDETDSVAGINGVAGVLGCVVTDLYYTWIQVGGIVSAKVAASTVAGDKMIGNATDLTFNRIAVGGAVTDVVFGVAHGALNTTTGLATVLLQDMQTW